MFKWFKKHFIPHEGNNHQPHFLRTKNIRVLVLVIFLMEVGILVLPFVPAINLTGNDYLASVLPAVLDDLTNQNRQAQNLAVLTVNPVLNKVAELKAKDMAEKSYFSHTNPEGKDSWYWFNLVGYEYEYAGENLAVDFTDSQDVTSAWMDSLTHRANIEKGVYTEMGTGVATGTYNGNPTIFVAQVFGTPASVNIVAEPPVVQKEIPELDDTSATRVMGASTELKESVPATSEVIDETTELPVISDIEADVVPSQIYTKSSIFEKYITSPRHIANIIFVILGVLVGLALLLKLIIRTDKKHPLLITNGFAIVVLLLGVYLVNNYVAMNKIAVKTSFVSFQEVEI